MYDRKETGTYKRRRNAGDGRLCVTVQDRFHEVVYMKIFNDWMPDHKEWNKKTYDRFMSVISDMTCRLAG